MPKCSVKKCRNNTLTTLKKDGVSYFRFPQNELEREKWRRIISKERGEEIFKPNNSSVVCSCHFSEIDLYYTNKGYRKLKKGAFPHIETEHSVTTTTTTCSSTNDLSESSDMKIKLESQAEAEESGAEKNTEFEPLQECTSELNDQRFSPSPTFSDLITICDSPKTSYYKKSLKKCEQTIEMKNKQIQNLKKKNKRLLKRNLSLKEIVAALKKEVKDLKLKEKILKKKETINSLALFK